MIISLAFSGADLCSNRVRQILKRLTNYLRVKKCLCYKPSFTLEIKRRITYICCHVAKMFQRPVLRVRRRQWRSTDRKPEVGHPELPLRRRGHGHAHVVRRANWRRMATVSTRWQPSNLEFFLSIEPPQVVLSFRSSVSHLHDSKHAAVVLVNCSSVRGCYVFVINSGDWQF